MSPRPLLTLLWSSITFVPAVVLFIASKGFSESCDFGSEAPGQNYPGQACSWLEQLAVDAGTLGFWLLFGAWVVGLMAISQYGKC